MDKIYQLLEKAGFTKQEDNDFVNDWCVISIDYHKKGETIIVNNEGATIEELPTNYHAFLGWLFEKRLITLNFKL